MSSEDCLTFATIYRIGFSTAASALDTPRTSAGVDRVEGVNGDGVSSEASSTFPSVESDLGSLSARESASGSGTDVFVDTAPSSVELELGEVTEEVHQIRRSRRGRTRLDVLRSGETEGETETETETEEDEETDEEDGGGALEQHAEEKHEQEEEEIDMEATPMPPSLPPPASLSLSSAFKKWDMFCNTATDPSPSPRNGTKTRTRTRRRTRDGADTPPEERAPRRRISFSPVRSPFGKFEFGLGMGLRSPRREVEVAELGITNGTAEEDREQDKEVVETPVATAPGPGPLQAPLELDSVPTPTQAQAPSRLEATKQTQTQTQADAPASPPVVNKRSSFMKFDFSLRSPRIHHTDTDLQSDEHESPAGTPSTSTSAVAPAPTTPDAHAQTQTQTVTTAQTPPTNPKSPFRKFEFTLPSLPLSRSSKSSPRAQPNDLPAPATSSTEDPPPPPPTSTSSAFSFTPHRPFFDAPQSSASASAAGGLHFSNDSQGNGTMYEPAPVHQTLTLTVIRSDPKWGLVPELAQKARERMREAMATNANADAETAEERWAGARVYVDYEPGSYYEAKAEQSEFVEMLSDVERGVAGALALDPMKEMWGVYSFPSLLRHPSPLSGHQLRINWCCCYAL